MTEATTPTGTLSRDARKWGMICHLVALVGLLGNGIGFFVGPLAVWLIKKEDDPFINEQGKESVNFQLTMLIALVASFLLVFVVIGIALLVVVGLLMIILPIIAAIQANEGTHYRYPLTIRFIK